MRRELTSEQRDGFRQLGLNFGIGVGLIGAAVVTANVNNQDLAHDIREFPVLLLGIGGAGLALSALAFIIEARRSLNNPES